MLIPAATRGAKSNAASILDQLDKKVDAAANRANFQPCDSLFSLARDLSSLKWQMIESDELQRQDIAD